MDDRHRLDDLDAAALRPIVRRALRRRAAEPTEWRYSPLPYTAFLSGRTLLRFDGAADVGGARVPWSAVLKILRPPGEQSDERSGEGVWDREVRAYRSGLLTDLPGGLVAPRVLRIHRDRSGALWLWLEHVADVHDRFWPIEQYGITAQHLGQFNGCYMTSRPLPTYTWLNRRWADAHSNRVRAAEASAHIDGLVADPLARRAFPSPLAGRARQLLNDQTDFLAMLAQLPRTLCHHDASRANLFARRGRNGAAETVALDWEEIGPGAVGADLATFVFGTIRRCEFPGREASTLDRVAFDGYLRGSATHLPSRYVGACWSEPCG